MLERKEVKHDKFYTMVTYEVSHCNPITKTTVTEDAIFKINNFDGKVEVDMKLTGLKANSSHEAKDKLIEWLERLAQGLKEDNLKRISI